MPRRSSAPQVILDPGHGGLERYGGSTPGPREKHVNLELARRVRDRLGPRAMLTRTGDVNVPLRERARLARRTGAGVLVSIHANSGRPGTHGSEVWVHERHDRRSVDLARHIEARLDRLGPSRGVFSGPLSVLDPSDTGGVAACLVEADYLSDPRGRARLDDPRGLDRLADAIADGVQRYLGRGRRHARGLDSDLDLDLQAIGEREVRDMAAAWAADDIQENHNPVQAGILTGDDEAIRMFAAFDGGHTSPTTTSAGSSKRKLDWISAGSGNDQGARVGLGHYPLFNLHDLFEGIEAKLVEAGLWGRALVRMSDIFSAHESHWQQFQRASGNDVMTEPTPLEVEAVLDTTILLEDWYEGPWAQPSADDGLGSRDWFREPMRLWLRDRAVAWAHTMYWHETTTAIAAGYATDLEAETAGAWANLVWYVSSLPNSIAGKVRRIVRDRELTIAGEQWSWDRPPGGVPSDHDPDAYLQDWRALLLFYLYCQAKGEVRGRSERTWDAFYGVWGMDIGGIDPWSDETARDHLRNHARYHGAGSMTSGVPTVTIADPGAARYEGRRGRYGSAEATLDEAFRVPPFPDALRATFSTGLRDHAKAVEFIQDKVPARLRLPQSDAKQSLRAALEPYVDFDALATHFGLSDDDDLLAEAVHQFQVKTYADADDHDGKPGQSTLASLGYTPLLTEAEAKSAFGKSRYDDVGKVALDTPCIARFEADNGYTAIPNGEWYRYVGKPAVFGQQFRHHAHVVLVRQLRRAEGLLLDAAWAADPLVTPVDLGAHLDIRGGHSGTRSGTSPHGLGLALDIDSAKNPWVGGETPEDWDEKLVDLGVIETSGVAQVAALTSIGDAARVAALEAIGDGWSVDKLDRIGRAMGESKSASIPGEDSKHTPFAAAAKAKTGLSSYTGSEFAAVLDGIEGRSRIIANSWFAAAMSQVVEELTAAIDEFGLLADPVPGRWTQADVDAARADLSRYTASTTPPEFFSYLGTSGHDTLRICRTLELLSLGLARSLSAGRVTLDLASTRSFDGYADPARSGFFNHHEDFVIAMRDHACLVWGGVDFGRNASGDMMHFDARLLPYGQALRAAGLKIKNGSMNHDHPCWPLLEC